MPDKIALLATLFAAAIPVQPVRAEVSLLNDSFDPTRELYQEFNAAFAKQAKARAAATSS